jgi:PAS domain S-box-containing protein
MNREQILAILYEMAMVIGGEVNLRPLLTKTLQRLMYHTSFPAGMIFLDAGEKRDSGRVEVRLELAIGDFELVERTGTLVTVPAALLAGPAALMEDRALLNDLPCRKDYYSVLLRLPFDTRGVILLLAPAAPRTDLPLTRIFQPILANFAKAILLCRRNEAYTSGILAERDEARAGLERFRAALDTSFDGVLLIDPDAMRLVDFNRAAGTASAYSHEELLAMGPQDLMPGLDRDAFATLFADLAGGVRQEVSLDTALRRKDGGEFPVEARFTLLRQGGQGHLVIGLVRDITERKQAEEALRQSEHNFRTLFDTANDAIFIHDFAGRFLEANRVACERLGYSHEELQSMSIGDIDAPEFRALAPHVIEDLRAKGHGIFESAHMTRDGRVIPIEISSTVTEYYHQPAVLSMARDITERKQAERELKRLNRALRMVSLCNEALIHANDEAQLLRDVCRIIVETGHYRFVWVGLAEQDAARTVRPVAQAGESDAFVEGFHVTWADTGQGLCPSGTAIRENRVCVVADVHNAEGGTICPGTLLPDVASMVALPLAARRQVVGVLNIYSDTPAAFSEAEVAVLKENASDLAFGIIQLRRNQSLIRLGKAIANTGEGIGIVDMAGTLVYANKVLGEWFGAAAEVGAQGGPLAMFEDREAGDRVLDTVRQGGSWHGEATMRRQDGGQFPAYVQADAVKDEQGQMIGLVGMLTDLTEPKQAEIERKLSQEKVQGAMRQAIEAISLTVEARDPYTAGHQNRVAELAVAIAREMGLPEERIQGLHLAGIVHDLGKIRIPAEILAKPGRLNEVEYTLIKIHPDAGYDILKGVDFPWPVAEIVREHQERLDGSGYPRALKGEEILLEARILAVADTVEAMASHRPYRPSKGVDAALEEIRQGRGIRYDAEVADCCLRIFERKGNKFWD